MQDLHDILVGDLAAEPRPMPTEIRPAGNLRFTRFLIDDSASIEDRLYHLHPVISRLSIHRSDLSSTIISPTRHHPLHTRRYRHSSSLRHALPSSRTRNLRRAP